MPENLSSVLGGSFDSSTAPNAPEKKKLKKVGDHWEDEQGNKFADEAGTQPIKGEGEQAAGDKGATNVQTASSFMDQLRENPGQNRGNFFTGEVGKKQMEASNNAEPRKPDADRIDSDKVYSAYKDYFKQTLQVDDAEEWYKRWKVLPPNQKKAMLERINQAEKAG